MINRTLILSSCQQRNIMITDKQVDEEIDRMAGKFSLPKDQWLKMLEKERGIKPLRYAQDIIWPTLALRELAKHQLTVTRQEIDEAYESEFGPAVKVRLIAIDSADKARQRPRRGAGQARGIRHAGQEVFARTPTAPAPTV